ncbi:MAG: sulfotransferase [Pseudomonadota bacterium]
MATIPAPILFVGAPRSGTTITFEQFASHPDLAWVTNYAKALPRVGAVNLVRRLVDNRFISLIGQKNQFNDAGWWNNYLPRPDESYPFWNAFACEGFDMGYLLGRDASTGEREALRSALEKVRRYQGRDRVTAKMTGPGRIQYLNSIWPDVYVVQVIRDGLGVVRSLLNVNFWKNRGGYEKPWWFGHDLEDELEVWRSEGSEPGALAALQWRHIIETSRREARELLGDRYIELKYESFLEDSVGGLRGLYEHVGLDPSHCDSIEALAARNKRYDDGWSDDYRESLIRWMEPVYSDLGYA